MVLYGGRGWVPGINDDTWEWDGAQWVNPLVTGPGPRSNAAMAYDAVRHVVVLFGGDNNSETWQYTASGWSRVAQVGPPARSESHMVFDSQRQKIVMFGGFRYSTGLATQDTWEWDGTAWHEFTGAAPPARWAPSMFYDSTAGRTIVTGGGTYAPNLTVLTDTWAFDGTRWQQVQDAGAPAVERAAAEFHPRLSRGFIVGGEDVNFDRPAQAWSWNGAWSSVSAATLPPGRGMANIIWVDDRSLMMLFGGYGNPNDTHGFYGDTWVFAE